MNKVKIRQVLAAMSAGFLLTGMMCTWGFPAAALPQMESPNSSIHFTVEQSSWFATITLMMGIPGSIMGSAAYEWGGPRSVMLMLTPLLCMSTMAMYLASWRIVLEAGIAESFLLCCRVIQAIIAALLNPFIAMYIYEVCDQQLRGTLASTIEVWATMGFLLNYIAGIFMSWSTIALLLPTVTLIPAFIGLALSPESPLWLARKGKKKEARGILNLVRCTPEEATEDLATVRHDLETPNQTCSEALKEAVKLSNFKAIVASCTPLIMKELSGYAALSIYIVYIFQQSEVGLDPKWSSVIVGVTRVVCNCFASYLSHNFSRKLILTIGNTLTAIATFAIGVFFHLQNNGIDISYLSWLPLTGLIVYVIGSAAAVGPCTWTVSIEVLPGSVRSLGFGLANMSYAITSFIISKTLVDLQGLIGLQGVFWFFSCGSVGYILLVIFYIPDTYGRSLEYIENYWTNSKEKREENSIPFI